MTTPVAFTAHLQSFLESMKVLGYSPQTTKGYGSAGELFFAYLGSVGISNLLQIGSGTLRQYQHWLQERAYGSWTIATRLQGLRRFFCHLERNQALLVNPCIGLQAAKTPYRLPKTVLTTAEARQVLDTPSTETAVGLRDKAILEVFYSSGIRLEEMARLTVEDVDCKNGYLRVVEGKFAKIVWCLLARAPATSCANMLSRCEPNGRSLRLEKPFGSGPTGRICRSRVRPSRSWSGVMAA
jgi:integrase/recombinase XerD